MTRVTAAAVGALLTTLPCLVRGQEDSLSRWYESLRQPESGVSCCSIADCGPVDYRITLFGYEAHVDGQWLRVPAGKVLRGEPNPNGRAVLCRSPISLTILCFVPASDT